MSRDPSVLIEAACMGFYDEVYRLATNGWDINAYGTCTRFDCKISQEGTALIHAAGNGQEHIVALLLELQANIDAKHTGTVAGKTALHFATEKNHPHVVAILLNNGADVDIKNGHGMTPLHYAASNGDLDIIKLLLQKAADIFALDKNRNSVLHYAAASSQIDALALLVGKQYRYLLGISEGQRPILFTNTTGLKPLEVIGKCVDHCCQNDVCFPCQSCLNFLFIIEVLTTGTSTIQCFMQNLGSVQFEAGVKTLARLVKECPYLSHDEIVQRFLEENWGILTCHQQISAWLDNKVPNQRRSMNDSVAYFPLSQHADGIPQPDVSTVSKIATDSSPSANHNPHSFPQHHTHSSTNEKQHFHGYDLIHNSLCSPQSNTCIKEPCIPFIEIPTTNGPKENHKCTYTETRGLISPDKEHVYVPQYSTEPPINNNDDTTILVPYKRVDDPNQIRKVPRHMIGRVTTSNLMAGFDNLNQHYTASICGKPSEQDLWRLSKVLGHSWQSLAIHLGIPYHTTQQFQRDYPYDSTQQNMAMLMCWRTQVQSKAGDARCQILQDALVMIDRGDLADIFMS